MKGNAQRKPASEPAPTKAKGFALTKVQQKTVDGLETVSARIRYLTTEGLTRSQITKVIPNAKGGQLLYQHVRNVQIQTIAKAASAAA